MKPITDIHEMTLSSGAPCLDFINTGLEIDRVPVERLHDYNDLLTLVERLKLMSPSSLHNLRSIAESDRNLAQHCIDQARTLRLTLYEIFYSIANHGSLDISKKHLNNFNAWRGKALANQEFIVNDNHLQLNWSAKGEAIYQPIWIIALSANDLLQKPDLQHLKQCSGCDWLFYDQSKSHRRKWCDMQTCGSSAKAKRYYQRKKSIKKNTDD